MADKFKTLVHYVCHRMSDEPALLGLVKLNKILWYADVTMFKRTGQAITDSKYIKQPWGPVAKSLKPVLEDLQRNSIVVQRRNKYAPGKEQVQFFSTQEPDLSCFSAEEVDVVNFLIQDICYKHTAKSISNLSHDLTWKMHDIGEEMPLYRSYVMQLGQITDEDIAWARSAGGY